MKAFSRLLVTTIGAFVTTFGFGRYDDVFVVYFAETGETVTMTAIWE